METERPTHQFASVGCTALPSTPRASPGSAGTARPSPAPGGYASGRAAGSTAVPGVPSLQAVVTTKYFPICFPLGHFLLAHFWLRSKSGSRKANFLNGTTSWQLKQCPADPQHKQPVTALLPCYCLSYRIMQRWIQSQADLEFLVESMSNTFSKQ